MAVSVRSGVVVAGASYPDGHAAQDRLDKGQIGAFSPPDSPGREELLVPYSLGDGERDSLLLSEHANPRDVTLVIDDHLADRVSDRLGRQERFLLAVIVDLANGNMDRGSSRRHWASDSEPISTRLCSPYPAPAAEVNGTIYRYHIGTPNQPAYGSSKPGV